MKYITYQDLDQLSCCLEISSVDRIASFYSDDYNMEITKNRLATAKKMNIAIKY